MTYSERLLPYDDLSVRDRLHQLPVPAKELRVLVALFDLSDGTGEWRGSRRQLGDAAGCNGETANRRARTLATMGLLHVDIGRRGGHYRLLCLKPESAAPTPAPIAARSVSLSTACMVVSRLVQIAVAFGISPAFGVATSLACAAEWYRSADQRRTSARRSAQVGVSVPRPRKPAHNQPELTGFAEACAAVAPVGARHASTGARTAPVGAPVGAPIAETPVKPEFGAARGSAEIPPSHSHPTVPPSPQLSVPIPDGIGGTSGHQVVWWEKSIERQDLRTPATVQGLYERATAAGAWTASEMHRQQFFAFAYYCSRAKNVDAPGAFFTSNLGKRNPRYNKEFAERFANKDRDWAARVIKSLDLGPLDAPRSADLLTDAPQAMPPAPHAPREPRRRRATQDSTAAAQAEALARRYPNLAPKGGQS